MENKRHERPNRAALRLLIQSIKDRYSFTSLHNKDVTLLLDTDREIGKETGTPETRVGITPDQASRLIRELKRIGISLHLVVVAGAGECAGFPDKRYEQAGCKLLQLADLSKLPVAPDVVHALKEPSPHESQIPGPFIRIGALHLVNPIRSGIVSILRSKNLCSVLDGAAIGYCSYLWSNGYKTPIVSSMSAFAGKIAANKICELYKGELPPENRSVAIIGGGVAGQATAKALGGRCRQLIVLEIDEAKIQFIEQELDRSRKNGTSHFVQKNNVDNLESALKNASGVILAQRRGVEESPHIISLNQVDLLAENAVIVDIAIDQGGSIENPDIGEADDLAERIRKNVVAIKEKGRILLAEPNMPRVYPKEASQEHGEAILPYLMALLTLCAVENGPENTTRLLMEQPRKQFANWEELPPSHQEDFFRLIIQDLRNGMAFVIKNGELEICNPDYAKQPNLVKSLYETWEAAKEPI